MVASSTLTDFINVILKWNIWTLINWGMRTLINNSNCWESDDEGQPDTTGTGTIRNNAFKIRDTVNASCLTTNLVKIELIEV